VKAPPTVAVRMAEAERDAAAVAEIYRPVAEGSVISFEERPPEPAEGEPTEPIRRPDLVRSTGGKSSR
jgi:hypothetical protein